jgi:hypothetical protein
VLEGHRRRKLHHWHSANTRERTQCPRAAGATWGRVTNYVLWEARSGHTTVIDAAGIMYLMGGFNGTSFFNDMWISTNKGAATVMRTDWCVCACVCSRARARAFVRVCVRLRICVHARVRVLVSVWACLCARCVCVVMCMCAVCSQYMLVCADVLAHTCAGCALVQACTSVCITHTHTHRHKHTQPRGRVMKTDACTAFGHTKSLTSKHTQCVCVCVCLLTPRALRVLHGYSRCPKH